MAADVAARWAAADLAYPEVGQTASAALPAGYRHVRRSVVAGAGEAVFAAAAAALLGWQVQVRAGLRVVASAAVARPGGVVVLGIGAGPVRLNAPCRVVYVVDEPDRKGFAYGTLPGHPECGEESFLVQRRADGTLVFTITAFSRPVSALARAAGPVGRAIQDKVTARYLRALAGLPGQGRCSRRRLAAQATVAAGRGRLQRICRPQAIPCQGRRRRCAVHSTTRRRSWSPAARSSLSPRHLLR